MPLKMRVSKVLVSKNEELSTTTEFFFNMPRTFELKIILL